MSTIPASSLDLAVQEGLFLTAVAQLGLMPAWQYVLEHNPSGNLPYHNNAHMLHMTRIAYQLHATYGHAHVRTLVMAGLFHDFDHSGGKLTDAENIARAIEGFNAFVQADLLTDVEFPAQAQEDVRRAIRVTEFPFVHTPTGAITKCLRDADLLYSLSDASIEAVMDGLRQELEVKTGTPISYATMFEQQAEFMENAVLYTVPGQLIWKQVYPMALARMQLYALERRNAQPHPSELLTD